MENNRVWFVEDDGNDIFLIQRAIRQSGLPILASFVHDAAELRAMFVVARRYHTEPGALVTDLKLLGEDGFAIVRWVRSEPSIKSIPVFILSSSTLERDRQTAHCVGADAFLTKCCGDQLAGLLVNTLGPLFASRPTMVRNPKPEIMGTRALAC